VDIQAFDAVLTRDPFFRRVAERIEILGDANGAEADIRQQRGQLCLRQSTGDSTRPQVDVAAE
jgi:hypothetical protein